MTTQALSNTQFSTYMASKRGDPDPGRTGHRWAGFDLYEVTDGDVKWWVGAAGGTADEALGAAIKCAKESAKSMGAEAEDEDEWEAKGPITRTEAMAIRYNDDDDPGVVHNMWTAFLNTPGREAKIVACSEW